MVENSLSSARIRLGMESAPLLAVSVVLSAQSYFRWSKNIRPFVRLFRQFWPIPSSPIPQSPDDDGRLQLVPPLELTETFVSALNCLEGPEGVLGDYAEFGVYNGTSMICMHEATRRCGLDPMRLVGFDSFMGLPPGVEKEDGGVWKAGQFTCPRETAFENLIDAGVPITKFRLISGWYRDTLTTAAQSLFPTGISVAMIDCDAGSSARLALDFVAPILRKRSILFFDDWRLNNLDLADCGEYRAFRLFLHKNPQFSARALRSYNRKSQAFLLTRDPITP
jgi:hypothetical protein